MSADHSEGGWMSYFMVPYVPWWLVVVLLGLYALYKFYTWHFDVFNKLGVKGPKPYPLLGTMYPLFTKGIAVYDTEMRKYGQVVGTFQGRIPVMLIYDVDILKQIMVKDFANFTNRFRLPINDYAIEKMLTMLVDDHWKHVRSVMTPTFSSGKLRNMNKLLGKSTDTLLNNLRQKADSGEIFEFRDLCGAYTMDVIASSAFGLQIDSHNDPNNKFVTMGKKVFRLSFTSPKLLIAFLFPFLVKPLSWFKFTIFPREVTNFFVDVIEKTMSQRGADQDSHSDFLQLLMKARVPEADKGTVKQGDDADYVQGESGKWNRKGLLHEEILGQSFLFFIAGYETTANTLSLMAYNLATHPECQEKLTKEIDEAFQNDADINVDSVQKLSYLDMCLNETLRMFPAGPRTDRVASSDVTINGLLIPKDMTIGIPIYALQNDPDIWPEPEKFNPERFSSEAKEARNPYYFMPFGTGPRSCIGMRLAQVELKLAIVHILRHFTLMTCEKTQIPLVLDKLQMRGADGIMLTIKQRKN